MLTEGQTLIRRTRNEDGSITRTLYSSGKVKSSIFSASSENSDNSPVSRFINRVEGFVDRVAADTRGESRSSKNEGRGLYSQAVAGAVSAFTAANLSMGASIGASIAFGLTLPAAASAADLVFKVGQTPGGVDLCSGFLMDCVQGYALNGTNVEFPWRRIIADTAGGGLSPLKEMLKKCINPDKMEEVIRGALASGGAGDPDSICSFITNIWNEMQVTGAVHGLDSQACEQAKNLFLDMVTTCESSRTVLSLWGYIGIGAACLVALAAIAIVACCCYQAGSPKECLSGFKENFCPRRCGGYSKV